MRSWLLSLKLNLILNFKKNMLIGSCLVVTIIFGVYFNQIYKGIIRFENFKEKFPSSNSVLLAQDHRILNTLRINLNSRILTWTPLSHFNPVFLDFLLDQEDHRFYQHPGVDVLAFAKAIQQNILQKKSRGASTLTMQLTKNMFQINSKSFLGKIKQSLYALGLELKWSKKEILEAYLNTVSVKGDIQGVPTASVILLNKSSKYLTKNEAKLILKLINRPQMSWTKIKEKICYDSACLNEMNEIENDQNKKTATNAVDSPHYLLHRFLINQQQKTDKKDISEIQSSVNNDLQNLAAQTLRQQINNLKNHNVHDGAVLVLDNQTGNILTYVGSSGVDLSEAPYVDMVQAPRQIGSTVKPFLYATALEKNLIDLDSWIEDSPLNIIFPNGTYSPSNHDHQFHGWVHPGSALASSLNVPAVKIIQIVSVDTFWEILKKLNFSMIHDPDYYGPSLALGVIDGSLWQLTQAYRQLAINSNKIFSDETLNKIKWMISYSPHRALTFGQNSVLNVPQGFAVKTGTSKDMRDNWCVGFNHKYTVGVWVGNASASPMHNILGVTGAAPVWRSVVDYLLNNDMDKNLFLSEELQKKYFLTESQSTQPQQFNKSAILSPGKSSIYAIDPNIPARFQKILLEANGPQQNLRWKFKNNFLTSNRWSPEKGWQTIMLYRGNKKIDESLFLVK
jgi:penicillin-binding protein 1C